MPRTKSRVSLRFVGECFFAVFDATVKNANHDPNETDVSEAKYHKRFFLKPTERSPEVYLDARLGATSFFSKCDVSVNDYPISGAPPVTARNYLYQVVNRTLAGERYLKERYGEVPERISVSKEREPGTTTTDNNRGAGFSIPDKMKRLMESLDFERSYPASKPKIARFNFDGVFPFDNHSNVTRSLVGGTAMCNGFLPPGTKLEIALHKRDPLHVMLERPYITDTVAFDEAQTAPALADVKITFSDLGVIYESVKLENLQQMERIRRDKSVSLVDRPRIFLQRMASGVPEAEVKVPIDAGSQWVFIAMLHKSQVWPKAASNKNLHSRFQFDPEVKNLSIELNGKEESVLVKGGMKGLNGNYGNASVSCSIYHDQLVQWGIYDKSFQTMFPPGGKSYEQFIFYDFTKRRLTANGKMLVKIDYTDLMASPSYYLLSITSQQYSYTCQRDKEVECALVI